MDLADLFRALGVSSKNALQLARLTPTKIAERLFNENKCIEVMLGAEIDRRLKRGSKDRGAKALDVPTRARAHWTVSRTVVEPGTRKVFVEEEEQEKEPLFNYVAEAIRARGVPLPAQVQMLQAFAQTIARTELHACLGQLWRVGLSGKQFQAFCSECLSDPLPRWKAAVDLGITKRIPLGVRDSERKELQRRASKNLLRHLDRTIMFWEHEVIPRGKKGGNIQIPLIYFPNKSADQIQRLKALKKRLGKLTADLGEEPLPMLSMLNKP